MRRFILSVLLLGAILGAGHLLNHITAHETAVETASDKSMPSVQGQADASTPVISSGASAAPDSTAITLTQYIHN